MFEKLHPYTEDTFEPRLIYLADSDLLLADDLAMHLRFYGYQVRHFQNLDELEKAVFDVRPDVMVVGMSFPGGELAGAERVAAIQKELDRPCPTLFISERDDLAARLAAVRSGSRAFVVKPIDFDVLIDSLDLLSLRTEREPFRVLVVDDDELVASLNGMVLESAGITVELAYDAAMALEGVSKLRPELILLDIHMPGCSGTELATVIRQQQANPPIPVIFLSGEEDPVRQLAAIRSGGEDFLAKPIQPSELISAVLPLAHRYRTLRFLMAHDNLTGMLSRTALREALDRQLAAARADQAILSLALIDVDGLRGINLAHGEEAGDRVLRSFKTMLCLRLDARAILGRYESDTFAAVITGKTPAEVHRELEDMRGACALLLHKSEKGSFAATFSAAVASFPRYDDAQGLVEAAKSSLAKAQREGGNRVLVADPE